jgi:hypothetical protein
LRVELAGLDLETLGSHRGGATTTGRLAKFAGDSVDTVDGIDKEDEDEDEGDLK